jgi:hypothetical protein
MITYKGQSAESNVPTAGKTTPGKLDFRFADEEDAKEIAECVAASFSVEFDSESPLYNRKGEDSCLISTEQIEKDCSSANLRWIVMETPLPEEIVVATARLSMAAVMAGESKIIVDLIAFAEDTESTSVRDQMLVQVERVGRSQGIKTLVIEISQHREDLQTWLESCGYEELGGRMSEDESYIKPTMIFEYHKDLTKPSKVVSRAPGASDPTSSLADEVKDMDLATAEIVTSHGPEGGMAGLMSDLFTALHKEHPN